MNNTVINFQTIAVDFDGTLCYSKWPDCGQPNQPLITYLQEWRRNGNKLILWTCRAGEALSKAVECCTMHHFWWVIQARESTNLMEWKNIWNMWDSHGRMP